MKPTLDQYIADLLYDYDCVVVPQLGGFVTNYRPAAIDKRRGQAIPPGKDVRFNRNLSKNDGLLTSACAEANGWTFEEAGSFVRQEVEGYFNGLNKGQQVKLKKVGILYIDEHKNLRFEPDTTQNFLKEAWGFEIFALPEKKAEIKKPAEREAVVRTLPTPAPAVAKEASEAIEENVSVKTAHTRSIYWVAAATLLPFIGLSLLMGVQTGFKSPAEWTPADLIPIGAKEQSARTYFPTSGGASTEVAATGFPGHTAVFPYSFSKNRVDSTGVWIDLRKTTETAIRVEKEVKSTPSIATEGVYHIIAGCFGEHANAAAYVDRLRGLGYDSAILDYHKGLHRVRLTSFDDYGTAVSQLQELRADRSFQNAWLLKKPMKH